MEATQAPSNFNISNVLSTLRIFMSLAVPPLLVIDSLSMRIIGGIIFTIAAVTDYFDGALARKYGWITTYGKIVDPIADKMLTLGAFATLSYLGLFPWWILVPILAREIGITLLRFYFLYHGVAVAAVKSGKQKTTFQIAAIGFLYALLLHNEHLASLMQSTIANPIGSVLFGIAWLMLIGAFYQTVYSGYDFLRINWQQIFPAKA